MLIQVNLISSILANTFLYCTNFCIFSSYFSCDFKGVLLTSAILEEFLHPFQKSIGGLYGREGPVHIETFTDSEVLRETTMNWFLMRIIIAILNYLIVLIFEYKLTLWVFSLSQNVFSLSKQDSIRHNSSLV